MTDTIAAAEPRFPLGELCVTAAADRALTPTDIRNGLARHERADWGGVPDLDRDRNEEALTDGGCLFSAFRSGSGREFWVITEPNRSVTTVLLPGDY